MSGQLTIYVAPPATDRGLWRVRCDARPVEEFREEQAAIRRAAECVRMAETGGGSGVVKVELADGSWNVFKVWTDSTRD